MFLGNNTCGFGTFNIFSLNSIYIPSMKQDYYPFKSQFGLYIFCLQSKRKTCKTDVQEEQYQTAPHSFVFNRGHVGRNVKQLVQDTRTLMEPFTAKHLQVSYNHSCPKN